MKTIKSLFVFTAVCIAALISGVALTASTRIEATPISGEIEYSIPNITSGNMDLAHAKRIFDMMPNDIQEKAILAFRDIISKNSNSFYYGGVLVKHPSDDVWSFKYKGVSIVVKASSGALTTFFQMAPVI